MKIHILDTAFVKYLLTLNEYERAVYLKECFISRGELAFELAEYFNCYNPEELSKKLTERSKP